MTQVEHRHPEGAKHGSYYYNPESRSNVTKAKLGNRVTSKKHFIVHVFSKNPTKSTMGMQVLWCEGGRDLG